jgi:hypothetical protein
MNPNLELKNSNCFTPLCYKLIPVKHIFDNGPDSQGDERCNLVTEFKMYNILQIVFIKNVTINLFNELF